MRIVEDRDGQLAFDVGQAIRADRAIRARARADGCRHCGEPLAPGWRLCPAHARALLVEQADAREPYALAA